MYFYVKDGKLFTHDHKQIKVWHYIEGLADQNEYEFKFTVTSGAAGEAADQRGLAIARSNRDVLISGSDSSLGFNRFNVGATFDRDNDLIPILGNG